MHARVVNAWENARASLWLLPALLVVVACALAIGLLGLDARFPATTDARPWRFDGSASAAETLLSTLAGSLITVVSLAFSITIVALQQAATQLTPRVMRTFMHDRGNQLVFGSYIGTFTYALLVLRRVRTPDAAGGGAFVPGLAIAAALVLAFWCVGLLIYFIHHIATSLQVATVTDNIRRDLRHGIAHLYPQDLAEPVPGSGVAVALPRPGGPPTHTVRAADAGFLRAVDEVQLLGALTPGARLARVRPQVGDYVVTGAPLLEIWADRPGEVARADGALRAAFTLARERTSPQDLLFGVRQLVDIALRARSPAINDPTTAEYCLAHLGDVVAQLAVRDFPAAVRRAPATGTLLLVAHPDFAAIVDAAFSQIRRQARGDVHVTTALLTTLGWVAERARHPERAAAIRRQIDEVLAALGAQGFSAADEAAVRAGARAVCATLAPRVEPERPCDATARGLSR